MNVNSKAFGDIEVNERQKVIFPQGLFGFEEFNEYVLLDAEHEPFFWLQSINDKETAFILINPFIFRKDYEASLTNEDLTEIGLTSPENALVFVIVTIPHDGGKITANLQGPLIINKENMTGMQVVLSDQKWKTKHDIISEYKEKG